MNDRYFLSHGQCNSDGRDDIYVCITVSPMDAQDPLVLIKQVSSLRQQPLTASLNCFEMCDCCTTHWFTVDCDELSETDREQFLASWNWWVEIEKPMDHYQEARLHNRRMLVFEDGVCWQATYKNDSGAVETHPLYKTAIEHIAAGLALMSSKQMSSTHIEHIEKNRIKAQGKKEYVAFLNGQNLTMKQRVLAHCYDCTGYYADGRKDCENENCSLHAMMPCRMGGATKTRTASEQTKAKLREARKRKVQKTRSKVVA